MNTFTIVSYSIMNFFNNLNIITMNHSSFQNKSENLKNKYPQNCKSIYKTAIKNSNNIWAAPLFQDLIVSWDI